MFKKLKHRFILTNMAMLSAVLLLSFAAIYLLTAYQMQNQNLLKLENIHSTTLCYQEANERNDSFQEVCLYREKKYAVLTVSNTGEGIAPEHIDKIFDRFYRVDDSRKHTGSYGLGLPIAKSLVEQMGGTLSVYSVPYQQTTFTMKLTAS